MNNLTALYHTKLQKMLSVEEQIIGALPKLADSATNAELKAGLMQHLTETEGQRDRLSAICSRHGLSGSEEDAAFATLLSESDKMLAKITDPTVKDAAIIASSQVVEHIEIARYGTLIEWAKVVGDADSIDPLKETLGEEESTDKKLSALAEGGLFTKGVNEDAA